MVRVTRSTTVAAQPAVVLAYLADFGNAPEWDPGTVSCTRLDDGPVAVGARWHNVSRVLGRQTELEYRLTDLDEQRLRLEGRNQTATSVEAISAEPTEAGTLITYRATITFHGLARLADPLMRLYFERLGDPTIVQIARAVDQRA